MGVKHKQDRHNCSVLVNLKLFLSDLSRWRVHISGSHVPPGSGIIWHPPAPSEQRLGEDARDVIMKYSRERESSANIAELLVKQKQMKGHDHISSRKRVSYFVSGMKKRRRERDYDFAHKVKKGKTGVENVSIPNIEGNMSTSSDIPVTSCEGYIHGDQTVALEVPEPGQTVTYTIVGSYEGEAGETWPHQMGTVVESVASEDHQHDQGVLKVQDVQQEVNLQGQRFEITGEGTVQVNEEQHFVQSNRQMFKTLHIVPSESSQTVDDMSSAVSEGTDHCFQNVENPDLYVQVQTHENAF